MNLLLTYAYHAGIRLLIFIIQDNQRTDLFFRKSRTYSNTVRSAGMSSVTEYTDSKYIRELKSSDKFKAIEELAMVFENTEVCDDIKSLIHALVEREEIMSTGIGFGIAIPHAKINTVKEMSFAVGISKKGINFDSMDGLPVHLIILVAAGEKQHKEYLRLLSNIMTILKNENIREKIIHSSSPDSIIDILKP